MKKKNMNSIQKAFNILELLKNHPEGLRTGEIGQIMGIPVPTVSRLLGFLKEFGYAQRHFLTGKYVLGNGAFDLGRVAYQHLGAQLTIIADPVMKKLNAEVDESVVLEVGSSNGVVIVHRIQGSQPIQVILPPGTVIPYHVSPGGKCILAFMPKVESERILSGDLVSYTSNTITDRAALKKVLDQVRKTRIATTNGEFFEGIAAYGTPIFNKGSEEAVAALVISQPSFRSGEKDIATMIELLKDAAQKISTQMSRLG